MRRPEPETVTEERPKRLFTTNTAPVNGGRNYNGPKVAKFLVGLPATGQKDPMELYCNLTLDSEVTKLRTVSGGQFDWAVASERVTEAPKGSLSADGNRAKSAKAEGSLTARRTGRAGTKVGLSDPVVPSGRAIAQRIKATLGITG
ncbi:hypothetical protein Lal_00007123 [Lupinus albus]|nr:hypothetical protein Lal_00007123 [Lupinus albus]